MTPNILHLAAVALIALGISILFPIGQVVAQDAGPNCPNDLKKSGTFTFQGNSTAFIVGYRWGTGVLTLENGEQYAFNARGLKAGETGVREGTIKGTVYGLETVDDFIGHYKGAASAIVALVGMGGITLANSECVVINARHQSTGLKLSLPAEQTLTIQFATQ